MSFRKDFLAHKHSHSFNHLIPPSLCAAVSLLLALLPLVLWRLALGSWIYIADKDNLYYLELAAQVYYRHSWRMSDPVLLGTWTPFPWLQFAPAAMLAHTLGAGPFAINTIWLVLAGIGAAAGSYYLFIQFLHLPSPSGLCTILVIASSGLRYAETPLAQVVNFIRVATGHSQDLFSYGTAMFDQYRVVHPGLTLPLAFFQIGCTAKGRASGNNYRAVMPGLLFAAVIYSSLYDWTAMTLALAAAFILDRQHRCYYAQIVVIGLILGSAGIFAGISARPFAVGLPRISLMLRIPRNSYLMVPKVGIALAIVGAIWIFIRRRLDMVYLWSLGVAALALSDSARVTGLELHNGHWDYVWGPSLTILVLIIAAAELLKYWRRAFTIVFAVAATAYVSAGIYLRAAEALKTHEAVVIRESTGAYLAQRANPETVRLDPGAVVAGDELFADLATVYENQRPLAGYAALQSATMTDREWELRWALNWYLLGVSRERFVQLAESFADTYQWGPWAFGEISRSELAAGLINQFDLVLKDPDRFIQSRGVRYLAIREEQASLAVTRTGWNLIQNGPAWKIYARKMAGVRR